MATKPIKFTNGNVIVVGPLTGRTSEKAARSLERERIKVTSGHDPLPVTLTFNAEVALTVIEKWTAPDGTDVLASTKRDVLREMLKERPKLLDTIINAASSLADEDDDFKVDSGN